MQNYSLPKESSGKLSVQTTATEKVNPSESVVYEWFIIVLLLVGAFIYESEAIDPNLQEIPGFDGNNPSTIPDYLSYPIQKSRISILALVLCSGLPPILTLVFNGIMLKCYDSKFVFEAFMYYFHLMLRSMLFSTTATWFASNIIKYSIGRPRPNFRYLKDIKVVDSRLSFPSTHASIAFALLFQLSLYLYVSHSHVMRKTRNYHPWDSRNPYSYYGHWLFYKLRSVPLLSLLMVGIPTYFATYISCTRITDYQHFYSDVLAGIMIGTFFAVFSFHHYSHYLHYYPSPRIESSASQSNTTKDVSIQIDEDD